MMIQDITKWSEKLKTGAELGQSFLASYQGQIPQQVNNLAFVGMGGSGIAGRLLKTLLDKHHTGVTTIVEGTELPACVTSDTLVFVSTYSGNTWETVLVLKQLIEKKIPTIIITHGGRAAEIAQQHHIPWVQAPESLTPRSGLGSFLGIMLTILDHYKLLAGSRLIHDFKEHIANYLQDLEDVDAYKPFLELAEGRDSFHLWGISSDSAACAYRAQTQFNENSKVHAVTSYFPELCHNLVVGFTNLEEQPLVVLLHSNFLSEYISQAIEATSELLQGKGVALYKPPILGDTFECQLLHMILWADFASCYLGQARGVELEPVVVIDELKEKHKQKGITV